MPVKQSQIFGTVLAVAGLGTLIHGLIFCKFSTNQLIGTGLFDNEFNDFISNPRNNETWSGDHGFTFWTPVPVPQIEPNNELYPRESEGDDLVPEFHQEATGQPHNPKNHNPSEQTRGHSTEDEHVEIKKDDQSDYPLGQFAQHLQSLNSTLLVQVNLPNKLASIKKMLTVKAYIVKFWHASIFVITASLAQILVSLCYIFMKEKTIPSMSAFFYSYFFIFLTHLASFCVILNGKPNQKYNLTSTHNYHRLPGDMFVVTLVVNCLLIVTFAIVTSCTCNTEEYSDRCIDRDTKNRQRSLSTANILATNASTDRLNN